MANHEDDELDRLRSLFARAHETRELPSRNALRGLAARLRARLKKKAVVERIKTKKKNDAA